MRAVCLLLALTLGAQAPARAEGLEVMITKPSSLEAVFGVVDVEVQVYADQALRSVELFVDDRSVGKRSTPPWRFQVDVGQRNVEHRFRVEAVDAAGNRDASTIVTPRIRVDEEVNVELQQLYVTATNGGGRVLDLEQQNFEVIDDGKRQELVTFSRGDVPLTAVLLLDSSISMEGERLSAGLRGAEAFFGNMKPLDEAMLLLFSDQLLHATAFTEKADDLMDALGGVRAEGNTAINDHLYLAMKLLDARQGRRVVVLFTDGADLHSVLTMREVLWKARRSQALIYWLRLDDGDDRGFATAWRDGPGNQAELEQLQEAVEQSGGRIANLESVDEVEPAFREILKELREQYVLGYYPSVVRNDGSWHKVQVKAKRSGVRIRTRGGYVDY